jgi:indolepyruvate decarboxylase
MTVTAGRSTASSATETSTMPVGEFLLRRIREAGVSHAFGVPGDYNLELLQQLEDTGTLEWVGTCNELNGSYAADGYARLNGMSALIVTNAVGALSAINGIAGSYAEHVPVICVAGSIPLRSIERGLGMHHTMADGTWDRFLGAFAQVTAAQARLTPANAATEIDRLILTAWREKLPVYLELPSDIAYLEIQVPTAPLELAEAPADAERLRSCADAITARLAAAKSPAILVDLDADRYDAVADIIRLAEKAQLPVTVASTAKAVLRHDCKPVIFLINNRGYTIERCWLGKTAGYNDVADWSYADLPKVFRADTTARSFVVKTVADLEKALRAPNDSMIFIEAVMDPFDAPTGVINSGNNGADLDYGPRGPQYRDNMLIRPGT